MNTRLVLGGLKSYLPVRLSSYKGTGGTVTSAYCYSVWLRHLSIIKRSIPDFRAEVMVELGPGDSIGMGIAALLTGATRYVGLDVLEHANTEGNLRILDELAVLFREHARIPDEKAFPRQFPRLKDYAYPDFLDQETINQRLTEGYLAGLRRAIREPGSDPRVRYLAPWTPASVDPGSANLVISQVTLQDMDHTQSRDDLRANLAIMAGWLCKGGVMSHQVDFSCPGGTPWNHHWQFSDFTWRLVRGNRPYYVNRAPFSEYKSLFNEYGFDVVGVEPVTREGLKRTQVAPRFQKLPDEDYETTAALLVAVKR